MNDDKKTINFWYFGVLFLLLAGLHVLHVQVIQNVSLFSRFFFLTNAVVQSLIEVLLLVVIVKFMEEKLHKGIKTVFVVLTFFLFLIHCADFAMQRIMDMSIWFTFSWLLDETLHNFIEMLYASDVPMHLWMGLGVFVVALPFIAYGIYHFSHRISKKSPLSFPYSTLFNCIFAMFLGVCVLNFCSLPHLGKEDYMLLRRTLPWKSSLFSPRDSYLPVQKFLKEPLSEKATIQKLQAQKVMPKKKPNIFLFVTESLREDFMTKEIAPNLHSFKQENIAISNSFSNANNSHHSWFCIFYSKLPFYWDKYKFSNWKSGSVPLQILKQMGYKIHLYTSARLSYYEMDNRIFGENQYLADSVCFKPHEDGVKAFESDTLIVDQLRKDIQSLSEEGHVFITFLDSTHFNYSWPEETDSVFTPYVDSIDYIGTSCFKKDLEEVKNRYRNAIHYVDKLFGKVVETVKSTKGWDDSVIIFTGDHGEEFMEPRNLFHASELNKPQTNVPIYLKLGMNKEKTAAKKGNIISHIDVFPSVLHHLLEQDYYSSLFDGQSILRKNRHSFVISSRYNASRAPFEFCLNNGNYKLLLRFKDEKQIFQSPYLQVLSMKNAQDESLDWNLALIREQFGESLQKIFSE